MGEDEVCFAASCRGLILKKHQTPEEYAFQVFFRETFHSSGMTGSEVAAPAGSVLASRC